MMKRLYLLLAILIFPWVACAASKVQEIKTPAGFTVWLVEEHSLPIVNMQISFTGSGTAYDPETKDGRTNMVAALLLEGAGDRDSKAFNEQLESLAIRMNIGAEEDTLAATLQTLTEHKEQAFSMLADALIRPRFDEEAIARTRAKMQVLLTQQSESPHYKLSRGFQENLYGSHPYARMGMGTKESLNALSPEDFKQYVAQYLTRENIVISAVGDVSAAEISALIDQYFAALPTHYDPDTALSDVAIPAAADMTTIPHDMPQAMIAFGLAGIKRSDPDYIPAFIMNHVLGGSGLGSVLSEEIRVKRGFSYGVRTNLEPKRYAGSWQGMFSTKHEQAKEAIAILKDTLKAFAENGVSEEDLNDAKAYLTGSFVLGLSDNEGIANFLNVMQIHNLGSDYLDKRNSLIEAVTMEDIKRVTKRIIRPEYLRIVMVGKQSP